MPNSRRRRPSAHARKPRTTPAVRSVLNNPRTYDAHFQHLQALATEAPLIAYAIVGHTERLARRHTHKFREHSKPDGKS
jgi:hypothetical protein